MSGKSVKTTKMLIIISVIVLSLLGSIILREYILYPVSNGVLSISEQILQTDYNTSCFDWREIKFNLLLNENKVNTIVEVYRKNCDFDEVTLSLCVDDIYKNFGEISYSATAYTDYPINCIGKSFEENDCLRLRIYGNETPKESEIIIILNATLNNTFYNKYEFKSEDTKRGILNVVYSELLYDTDLGSFSALRGDLEENGNIDILHSEPIPPLATKTYKYNGEDMKIRFRPKYKTVEITTDFFFALSICILGGIILFFISKINNSTQKF